MIRRLLRSQSQTHVFESAELGFWRPELSFPSQIQIHGLGIGSELSFPNQIQLLEVDEPGFLLNTRIFVPKLASNSNTDADERDFSEYTNNRSYAE